MARRAPRHNDASPRQNGAGTRQKSGANRQKSGGNRARQNGASRTSRRPRHDNEGVIPVLARVTRELESAVQRGKVTSSTKAKFQAVALLVREERARIKGDAGTSEAKRAEELKRLDGIATILATTAVRESGLLALLADEAVVTDRAREMRRELLEQAGLEVPEEPEAPVEEPEPAELAAAARRVVPQSVISRQLANPFLPPDFSAVPKKKAKPRRLAGWELIEPLLRSFESGGGMACMDLPEPGVARFLGGRELMPHQASLIAAAAEGHRTFLLADEPGLGKTAQALLAAEAADAYPLLVVVPNVVKMNWAREAELWTPSHPVTVVHGDGDTIDGFADIIVVNYEVLDRHVGWLGQLGLRGIVVDEAHYIKNPRSQRSQNVLELSRRVRERRADPLLMALTGTPLINDIEDFTAIWQFLGWIDETRPLGDLMEALEDIGLTPADRGFASAAREAVIDQGIVRRRKVDVAADLPARRVADVPVELDGEAGRSVRAAEQRLARRLLARYDAALEARHPGGLPFGIDHDVVRQVAAAERSAKATKSDENVFTMMRHIGQAKAGLAADYAAQLARNAGKVVFFAKHIDVMDAAEETFAKRGLRYASIRGDQTAKARQKQIDAFTDDPEVAVIVCSLTAAGVGVNLQVASNLVLAELSWTDAEQTQAIDRVHRIGQDQPVTAWRIIAAQTLDTRIAELIGSKAGLAARALDGAEPEETEAEDVQLEALVTLLEQALEERVGAAAS